MGRLLAAVAAEQNVLEAWQRTLDRLPAEPILIPEVENFRADLLSNLTEISTALRSAEWTPKSLRTTTIAKADGTRTLRIPSVADRVAERAIATVLTRSVDHRLQPDSYAFRPGVGVEDARRALQARIDAGNRWVVRTDIADCFDSLSRRGCTRAVAEMIDDPDLMTIITRCIDRSDSSCSPIGIAQGSPLSPVISNIYLDGLDQELWTNGADIVRYADDIACAAETPERAQENLDWIRSAADRRSLTLNPTKTAIYDALEGVPFLGATIRTGTPKPKTPSAAAAPRITVHITERGSALRARGTKFVITTARHPPVVHPASRTRMIVCNDRTMLTTGALTLAARTGVNIAVVDRYSGLTAFLDTPHDRPTTRRAQYNYLDDTENRLDTARLIVDAKIANSVTLLRRTPTRRERVPLATATRLNHLRAKARDATSSTMLLGLEGSAARLYFHGLSALIPEEYSFTSRRRRPPTDPVNAMLSYGYTVLLSEATRALELALLDPTIGFLHTPHRGRPSLALDLMEEFRTLIVDTAVLRLIAIRAVSPSGFATTPGGCRMDTPTKHALISEIERRLSTPVRHPRHQRLMPYRECLGEQARLLARIVTVPNIQYTPMPWR